MDFTDYQSYCSEALQAKLKALGFKRRPEDKVADETKIPLMEARYWVMRALNAIYFQIWNNKKGLFEYKVTFTDSSDELYAVDFDKSSDALEHALNAICEYINENSK